MNNAQEGSAQERALSVKNLSKSFGANKVIDGISFDVPQGCVFGFIGVNGAGKTTTIKMILGLLASGGGEIFVCGEKAVYGKTAKSIGYLPDIPEFYNYMRPMEYLSLCGEISGMTAKMIKERSKELLELVGLSKINRKIGGFSRGMKQRLGMAQALLGEPKLLICDEPTSALDPMGRKDILDILTKVKNRTTVVFSTHILSDVERICDRLVVLHGGKIVLDGSISEIKKQHAESYGIEFSDKADAEKLAVIFKPENVTVSDNTAAVRNTDGKLIIKELAENKLVPVKFELLEPTLEDLFIEATK